MISASLLTALKVAVPVGTVASMGGAIYVVSGYLPKKSNTSNSVYLVVAGKTIGTNTGALTKTESNKTIKEYLCEATLKGTSKVTDKDCALFNLNTSSVAADASKHIDFHEGMFNDASLTQTAASVKTTSKHILRLSKAFYDKYSKASTNGKKTITLTQKSDTSKHFGVVEEEFNLGITKATSAAEYSSNLFLARIHEKGTATTPGANPFSCKLSATKTVDCKIYKFAATPDKTKTNDHNSTSLSNLTAIDLATTADYEAGKYIVVELINAKIKPTELHNQLLEINKKGTTGQSAESANKVVGVYFDQVLLGKVVTTPASSTIYPLTPKTETYVVKKGTVANFTDITTTGTKNYKCKFTLSDTKYNYDNSCVLKTFPTTPKIHSYASMVQPTSDFVGVSSNINDKDYFLLTVDKNKLFNLNPNWTEPTSLKVVTIVEGENETKNAEFTIQHAIKPNKAEGKVKLALVKYKAKETTTGTPSPTTKKCFFNATDTTGFTCSLKKTTSTPVPASPYTALEFDASEATAFAKNDHFALLISDSSKDFNDFESNVIYAHLQDGGTTSKYTFDVIALMGGEVDSGKIAYFLEAPRTITAAQQK